MDSGRLGARLNYPPSTIHHPTIQVIRRFSKGLDFALELATRGKAHVTGQNQYAPARSMTSQATHVQRGRRTTDPARLAGALRTSRLARRNAGEHGPLGLLLGGALLLGGLLAAVPREVPAIALSTLLGGAWLSIVLAITLPARAAGAGAELARRIGQFRHEVNTVGDRPARADLERLLRLAQELELREAEVANEFTRIRASLAAVALRESIARGEWPLATSPDPLPPGHVCHFMSPVRFGRRRADQYGHLVLTSGWLKFRGALDMSVAWSEVAAVQRADRELIVMLQRSKRVLRFSCQTVNEAACGGVIAELLSQLAQQEPQPGEEPASRVTV
jgi:hypothetical protein